MAFVWWDGGQDIASTNPGPATRRLRGRFGKLSLLAAALALLTACEMPRGAATRSEILSAEDVKAGRVQIVPVTRDTLPDITRWKHPAALPRDSWPVRRRGPKSAVIRPGDRLNLTIWDSDTNSLYTAPEQKSVSITKVQVSPAGELFVPYVGKIVVSGMTPDQAREEIQARLGDVIASAQVQLSMESGRMNSVDLVGGVAKPGSYPLPDRDYTVLNLISAGGGVAPALQNPRVQLVRNGRTFRMSLKKLFRNPGLDTTLQGGDKVIITEDDRYFLALGAAGTEKMIPFPKDSVSALDAMSLIGGLSDDSADPKGVLILREYPRKSLVAEDAATPLKGPTQERVVFTIDLTAADGLFSARNFPILSGDLVLITDAPGGTLQKILGLIGSAVGVANKL